MFSKIPSAIETINDIDSNVVNLFHCIQKDSEKLEEVRADIVNIRHMLLTEDTALDQAILGCKKGQLEKWAIFLEDLLSGGAKKTVGEDWKQRTMERFERVE